MKNIQRPFCSDSPEDNPMIYNDPRFDHSDSWCPHCRYPMLKLHGFEGVSSALNNDLMPEKLTPFIGYYIFAALLRGFKVLRRRRRALQLQKEILPEYPFSLICPQCFHVDKRR